VVAPRSPQDIRQWIAQLSSANIDESHLATVDLTKPLIVAPLITYDCSAKTGSAVGMGGGRSSASLGSPAGKSLRLLDPVG
jgi:hypothetical protein